MPDDARPVEPDVLPLRRFSRAEFDGMVARRMFGEGERVELIGGIITSMMGEGDAHVDALDRLATALWRICPPGLVALARTRLDLGEDTEVYPDILVQDEGVSAADRSPVNVHLLVEISDSSLATDRKVKAAAYAEAGFREYWVLGLKARRLWIYREPANGKWSSEFEVGEEGAAPLFAPAIKIDLSRIMPAG